MANKNRSEIDIKLDNENITLRPSFNALAEIEYDTKKSIINLVKNLNQDSLTLNEMVAIIHAAAKAGGSQPLKKDVVGEAIINDGVTCHLKNCTKFLINALKI